MHDRRHVHPQEHRAMTTEPSTAISAVRQYLEEAFPGWTVEDFTAMPERQAHRFQVRRRTCAAFGHSILRVLAKHAHSRHPRAAPAMAAC